MCYFSQINSPFFDLWRLHHTSASTIFGSTNVSPGSRLLLCATISSFWQCQNQSLPLYKTSHFYGRATRNLHAFVATIGSSISRLFIDVSQLYPRIRVWGVQENWPLRLSHTPNTTGIHSRSTNSPAVWQLLQLLVWNRNRSFESVCRWIPWYCWTARNRRNKALQPIRHLCVQCGMLGQMSMLWSWAFKFNFNLYSAVRNF